MRAPYRYGIDLMEVAKKSGAHVIVMVDYD